MYLAPRLVPPAPLRISAFGFEERPATVRATARVAAPAPVPVLVTMTWSRGGEDLRVSRGVAITAHGRGFRVWDEIARARLAAEAGELRVELFTGTGQLLGRGTLAPTNGG